MKEDAKQLARDASLPIESMQQPAGDANLLAGNVQQPRYLSALGVGLVLFFMAASVTMTQYKIPTIMTEIMAIFGCDAGMVSWFMSIFTLVGVVVAVPTGFLMRRVGPKKVILAAAVVNVVAALAGTFAGNAETLLVTRAFEGVSLVFVVASSPLVIQACVDPSKTGTATGIYMLGGMLGATFAGVLTPALYYGLGYEGLWVGYAAIVAVAGVVFALYVRMPNATGAGGVGGMAGDAADAGNVSVTGSGASDYRVFFRPNTLLFLAPFAVFQMVLLTILSYAPMALQQQGASPMISGIISTLPMLLAVISSIAFGVISDRIGRCKPLCLVGMLVLGPCCLVMLNFSGAPMWVALVVMGLLAMGTPTVFVAAYPTVLGKPELMSIGMGVLLLVQSLGQFLGTAVSSVLLGPSIDQWMLCGTVVMALGLAATACVALCKFR